MALLAKPLVKPLVKSLSKNLVVPSSDVLAYFDDADVTQNTAGRYIYNPWDEILYGPFGPGELATFDYDDGDGLRKYAQIHEAWDETCGHSETFDYWTTIGGATGPWDERQPAGDFDKNWLSSSSDSTGQYLIAGNTLRLYTSDDYGATWDERRPAGDVDRAWYTVASDSTGQHLVACAYGGRLYTSDDYGATWTERRPAGDANKDWYTVASDSTGQYLIAGINGFRLYTSDDYGVTWDERRPAGDANKDWRSTASDSTGQYLVAGNALRLYTSDDYGATWDERRPAGDVDRNWKVSASDSTGQYLVAGGRPGRLYTSDDYGATWDERQPAGAADKDWHSGASDSTGRHLLAGIDTGRMYASNDYGATWAERRPAGDADRRWYTLSSNDNGKLWMAGAFGARLHTRQSVTAPDSNKLADILTLTAAAADGIKIALGSGTADTDQTTAWFVRSVAGTKDYRLQFLLKDGTTAQSADKTATTTWQRVDFTADILAGGTTPEVRIINDVAGNAGQICVFCCNVYKDMSVPGPPMVNEGGGDAAYLKDQVSFAAGIVPAAILSGKWAFKIVPFYANGEYNQATQVVGWNSQNRLSWRHDKSYAFSARHDNVTKVTANPLTFSRNQLITTIVNNAEGSVENLGATTGNGKVTDTPWAWARRNMIYGAYFDQTLHISALISEPYRP